MADVPFDLQSPTTANLFPVERALTNTLRQTSIERLRTRLLAAVTTSVNAAVQARTVTNFAYSTEIANVFADLFILPATATRGELTYKKRYLTVDSAVVDLLPLLPLMLQELQALRVPDAYVTLFERHIGAADPNFRVAGWCALVLFAAVLDTIAKNGKLT